MISLNSTKGRIQKGDRGPPPLKNCNTISFLGNTGQDHLENHKASKPAFIVELSLSAHQEKIIKMTFDWRADDGPLFV